MGRHARPVRFDAGEIVCRKGDYGGLLYFVLEGTLREVIADRDDLMSMADLPRLTTTQSKRSFWKFWKKQDEDDIVVVDTHVRQTLANVEEVLGRCETRRFEPASEHASETIVGGLAALTRSPFPRTVFAETPVRLLAMHWRGMRDLIGLCEPVRRAVNAQCCADIIDLIRSDAFEAPALSLLPQDALAELVKSADFRFTGSGASEFTAVRQGEPIHEVLMVVSGFGRVRHESAGQRRSVGFVRRGDMFGLAALAAGGHGAHSATTLDFLGNVSALVLPAEAAVEHCLPFLSDEAIAGVDPASGVEASDTRQPTRAELRNRSNEARLVDFLVDNAFVRGRQAMVIDPRPAVSVATHACAPARTHTPVFRASCGRGRRGADSSWPTRACIAKRRRASSTAPPMRSSANSAEKSCSRRCSASVAEPAPRHAPTTIFGSLRWDATWSRRRVGSPWPSSATSASVRRLVRPAFEPARTMPWPGST